jgi:predicted nucleic acid-binding protein
MLVDTSVWVDHFRHRDPLLVDLLESGDVECHPFIIGELACGRLRRRTEILALLHDFPQTPIIESDEALAFLETEKLTGSGLGWIDVHLLASTRLGGTQLWSGDRRLAAVARRLGLSGQP